MEKQLPDKHELPGIPLQSFKIPPDLSQNSQLSFHPIAGNDLSPRLIPTFGTIPICGSLGVCNTEKVVITKTVPTATKIPGVSVVTDSVTAMIPDVMVIK